MSGHKKQLSAAASLSLAAVLLSCGLAGCGKLASADSLVAEARQYREKGDDTSAAIQLKNALQKSPDNVDARYLLGVIENETGDPLSAEKELRRAVSLGMAADKVAPDLGRSLLMQGQFQKVLDETGAVASQGDVPALRGNAFLGLGKLDEAKQAFQESLKTAPDSPAALTGLAKVALVEKDTATANQLAEQAVTKNPQNVPALMFRANLLRAGPVDPALAAFDKVLAVKPNDVDAHLSKADLEIRARNFAAAKVDIDAARKTAPNNLIVQYMQAVLDFSQGKNAEALESVQKVVQAAPDYMPGVLIAGAAQYALGVLPQAEQYLTKYLDRNPEDIYARKLLTSTYLKSGKIVKAGVTLAPALKAAPDDPDVLGLAGEINMQNKDFNKAREYFEKASTLAPDLARFHTALGLSNLGLGQNDTAVAELKTASNMDAASPQAGILLVMTHIRLKEYDQALAAANALEKDQPKNPLVQDLKGGIYLGKNDDANARASFDKALALQPDYFPAIANLASMDLKAQQPEVAKKRFEAVLAKDKKNISALNALASLAMAQKHPEQATVLLERASAENPDSIPASARLASHYLQIGEKQKALTLARKLQVANPADPSTMDLLAQIQFATGDQTGALQTYQRLAAALPDSAQVQMKIASAQVALKDTRSAADSVRKALALQPGYIDAEVLQASLYAQAGNQSQALAIAKLIQQQPGQAAMGYELEGNFAMFQKKPDLAAKAYDQSFAADNQNPRILVKLLGALSQSGDTKGAEARVKQWFQAHPDDVGIHMYLAENALFQKQNKVAIEHYEAALRQQPQNVGALNNLAWAYQQEHDPRAIATAEKAYQLAPDSPPVIDTYGWMLVEQGDAARGLPLLQKASDAAPDATDIRYHLAQALLKSGDKPKARTQFQKLIDSGKPFPQKDEVKATLGAL
jgi:putative PEP-CTERM system TPR-repeat lipoprotein